MCKFIISIILISLFAIHSNAINKIDSLKQLLVNANEDTFKVKILATLSSEYFLKNTKMAISHGEEGLELSIKLNYKKGISTCYNLIGNANARTGNYFKAIELYNKSIIIDEDLGNKKGIADNFNNIGNINYEKGNFSEAIEYYEKSINISHTLSNKKFLIRSYYNWEMF